MKTIMTLVIGCTLAWAGAVIAQPTPETQESPNAKKGGKAAKTEQTTQGAGANQTTGGTETQGGGGKRGRGGKAEANANAAGTETNAAATTETGGKQGRKGRGAKANAMGAESSAAAGTETNAAATTETSGKQGRKGRNAKANADANAAATGTGASAGASATVAPSVTEQMGKKGKRGKAAANAQPSASVPVTGAGAAAAGAAANAATGTTPAPTASVAAGTSAATTTNTAATTGGNAQIAEKNVGRGGKRVETQKLQQIKQQHTSFKAQPKPNVAPPVTFNQNYRIQNVEQWQGPQYEVYRSYHPEWHDQGWYHSRYPRVELIAGGYYFFNNGYWYPAWGYDQRQQYYAYDAPIYVGHRAEPPDRVIADVQAELQDMGYYTGEVDGLLGPLTRQAVRDYQADHGLMVTEVIDEPTLDALQLS